MKFDVLFVRAVRGPVMLIALGTLFAMDQAGGWGFERTWPVLIILFGVFKLLERSMGPVYAPYPYGPGNTPYGAPVHPPPPPIPSSQPPKETN